MNIIHYCHKCLFGFGIARIRGFWEMSNADVLVNVNLCLYFVLVCACEKMGTCVSCMTWCVGGWVCGLSCGMLQSHVHGPVT